MSRRLTADGALKVACDPSFAGSNATVIATRRGNVIEIADVKNGRDDTQSIIERLCKFVHNDPSIVIVIDDTGAGNGVVTGCQAKGLRVFPFYTQARATNAKFKDARSENYFNLAERIGMIQLPHDKRLRDELMTMKALTVRGRMCVEGKEDLAKRGISCDRADAVSMLFFEKPAMAWQYVDPASKDRTDRRPMQTVMDEYMATPESDGTHYNRIVRPRRGPFDFNS